MQGALGIGHFPLSPNSSLAFVLATKGSEVVTCDPVLQTVI